MRLFTWRLWRGIYQFPAHHPLFYRSLNPYERFWFRRPPALMYVMLLFLGVWMIGELATKLDLPLLIGAIGAAFAGGSLNGLHIVYNVSRQIAHQRETGQYDLIATTPAGRFVSGWAQVARHIRRHHGYLGINQISGLGQLLSIFLIFPFGLVVLPVNSNGVSSLTALSAATSDGLLIIFNGVLLVMILRLEYMRAIGSAALISLLVSSRVIDKANAGMGGVWLFLSLQILVYLILFLLIFGVVGGFLALLSVNAVLSSLIHVILIALIGEGVNRLLWRTLQLELNTDALEFDGLAQSADGLYPLLG